MGGRGPAPKESHSRARDTARRRTPAVTVVPDTIVRGPELPDGYEWPDATRSWWQHWRESPQAQTFIETDWSFLLDTALLHAEFWLGDLSRGAELRLRVAKFGATAEDRRRLDQGRAVVRQHPPRPEPGVVLPVNPLDPRRAALTAPLPQGVVLSLTEPAGHRVGHREQDAVRVHPACG
jgi:hypothetical protein